MGPDGVPEQLGEVTEMSRRGHGSQRGAQLRNLSHAGP